MNREAVVTRLRSLVEELAEDCGSCEEGEAALQQAATDITTITTDDGHVLGEPCDICGGRGFDYIGRMCRRYRKARNA